MCNKGFIWNSSNCNCKCDNSCDVGKFLDYENFKCKRKIVGELVDKRSKNIDENEMIYNRTLNNYKSSFCELYVVLFVVIVITRTVISIAFIYIH